MTLRLLFIGDIVGDPGCRIVNERLPGLREELGVDLCVANAENATAGSGLSPQTADALGEAGVDCFTLGDHTYSNRRIFKTIGKDPRILRPANLSPEAKGRRQFIAEFPDAPPVAVFSLLGRQFMKPMNCPFRAADEMIEFLDKSEAIVCVDFHAEATAEKVAMGWHLDGRAAAVIGTHTHVPTADARVLPRGAAYITDIGMTGPHDSVIGRMTDRVLHFALTQMPVPFDVATGDVRLNGALVEVDPETRKAVAVRRVEVREEEAP